MSLSWQVWLLIALLARLSWASPHTANMAIWDVDTTCNHYYVSSPTKDPSTHTTGGSDERAYVQDLFNKALHMAVAAQDALYFALQKLPGKKTDAGLHLKWIRIAESVGVTLGFTPKPDKSESPHDEYWADAFEIYNKIVKTLQSSQNDPKYGYNPTLAKSDGRVPMLACGDNWDWVGKDDEIPGTSTKPGEVAGMDYLWGNRAAGVWWKKHRVITKVRERHTPVVCAPGEAGKTSLGFNIMVLCDPIFTPTYKNSWVSPASVTEGDDLDHILTGSAAVVLHELTHWFGGLKESADGTTLLSNLEIKDQQAVDEDGKLLYKIKGNIRAFPKPLSGEEVKSKGAEVVVAYGVEYIWNLARRHRGNAGLYTGPTFGLKNADSLAAFAAMMYHDKWNWARKAKARPIR